MCPAAPSPSSPSLVRSRSWKEEPVLCPTVPGEAWLSVHRSTVCIWSIAGAILGLPLCLHQLGTAAVVGRLRPSFQYLLPARGDRSWGVVGAERGKPPTAAVPDILFSCSLQLEWARSGSGSPPAPGAVGDSSSISGRVHLPCCIPLDLPLTTPDDCAGFWLEHTLGKQEIWAGIFTG